MKHITLFVTAGIFAFTYTTQAQTNQKLNIDKATVFLSGAQLESSARIFLSKGENEVRFTNVAGDVNNQSIIVGATNGVVVESVTFQNNYLTNDNVSPRTKELKDSIQLIANLKQPITTKITVLNEQLTILQTNRKISGENTGLSVTELQKMLDLVGTKMENYIGERSKNEEFIRKMDERIAQLKKQLDEEQQKGYQPGGMLLIKFFSKDATNSNISIAYNVPHAGWSPTYDVMADDSKSPVKFFYKANIYQNSGVKWNDIKLSLSKGNPNEGMDAPVLSPWYLAFYQPKPRMYKSAMAPAANNYIIDGVRVQGDAGVQMGQGAAEDASTMDAYVTVDNSGINTTFDIELPYTIPTDGQQHLVAVKKYEAPATYQYFAAPKADKDAFLQAQVTNWEDFNLLPGPTNIFYEGTYVGQGNIDPRNVKDTMSISLGRDKKIVVKREQDKKLRSAKTIGSNVRETFAYNITVRNTRKETITIVLQDQQPVSNDKDIVIEDKETSGADYNETTGIMKWMVTLKPNESKTIPFGYTLKYPKGKRISGM